MGGEGSDTSEGTAPLVISGDGGASPLLINGNSTRPATVEQRRGSAVAKGEHLESFQRKKAADVKKNCVVGAIFAVGMASQIFVGIKCVSFRGAWELSHLTLTLQVPALDRSLFLT